MMNKMSKLIPLIVVFTCAIIMLIINLCDIGFMANTIFLICWSILLGVSGTLMIENVIKNIRDNKDGDKDNEKK